MRIVHFETENANLGPPDGDGGRNVADLPCRRVLFPWTTPRGETKAPAFMSFWMPSPRELASLNAGKPIGLMVCGDGHPPVTVFVDNAGAFAGEIGEHGTATQEDPVAFAWPEADRHWRDRQAARKVMADALQAAEGKMPGPEDDG